MQRIVGAFQHVARDHLDGAVDALQPFQVHLQAVQEDAVQRVARDLRERRMGLDLDALHLLLQLAPHADHEQAVGPQVQRGADRRDLAHRAVAEVLAVDVHRREDERQRAGGEQVIERDRHRHADAPRALPRLHPRRALIKTHRLARGVARAGDAEGGQVAAVDRALDRREVEVLAEQVGERRIVEQRNRAAAESAAGEHGEDPKQAVGERPPRIGAVDVVHAEVLPHHHQAPHAAAEVVGVGRHHGGVDGAGGSAADDGKGRVHLGRQQFGERPQHSNLVGGTRAASGHDQSRPGPVVMVHHLSPGTFSCCHNRASAGEHAGEAVEHARRGAPDVAALVRHRQVMPVPAAEAVFAALVVARVEKMPERRLEHRRHLVRIGLYLERRLDPAHHRRDAEARGDLVIGQPAEHSDRAACDADLLLGLAQRRLLPARVARLHPSARKADLAGVIVEVQRALREQHTHPAAAVDERDQHRGFGDARARIERDDVQVVRLRRRRRARESHGNVFPCQREYLAVR